MNKERIREIMLDQKDVFNSSKDLIQRDIDLDKFISSSQVVIVTGIRRCGKSSLMFLIKEKMQLKDSGFCYFNFDDERVITDTLLLENIYKLHLEIYGCDPVFFLDEIQNIEGWEKFVNRMYEQGLKVFVTGSNARLLSSEISTSLTGRNRVIELFPFSFSEYLRYFGRTYKPAMLTPRSEALLIKDFGQYLTTGGFPLVVKENDTELINGYFQDILYRDIISRFRLTQVDEIRQIGIYLASNTGKLFSYSTLQEISGVKSLSTIKDYLWYYEQSFLFLFLKKFDFSIRKQIMTSRKAYTIDPGFSNRIGFSFSANAGRILENVVFIELKRRGSEIFYHSGKRECDFLIRVGLEITEAIQVVYELNSDSCEREYAGLKEAMDTYKLEEGLLLVHRNENTGKPLPENVKVCPVWQWLLTASSVGSKQ